MSPAWTLVAIAALGGLEGLAMVWLYDQTFAKKGDSA